MLHARIFTDSVGFIDISRFKVEGMRVTVTRGWLYQPCDVAIMYGLSNPPRRSLQGQLRNAIHREHRGPIVVIESSLVGRGFKRSGPRWLEALRRRPLRPRQIHPYFRVGVGGALGDDADFCAKDSPADRWQAQSSQLNIKPAPYRTEGRHVLLLGQVARDASLRGVDIVKWLRDTAIEVRRRSTRPIVVRLHPSMRWRDRKAAIAACAEIADLTISPLERTFSADIADAWTCVTYSSGGAVDALLAGVPPICMSPANVAYELCSKSIEDIEQPLQPDREQFLRDIAYSQWTREEMADGTAWRHLLPAIQRELKNSDTARAAQRVTRAELPQSQRRKLMRRLNISTLVGQVFPRSGKLLQARAEALLELGHPVEAKVTFETLQQRRPLRPAGFRGAAKAAEQLGLWDEALVAWTEAHRLRPEQKGPLSGIGRLAMRLGRLDEAEAAFSKLVERFPDEISAYRGLERIANERGDRETTLRIQERAWSRFRDPAMLHRHVLLLSRLNRRPEAERVVASLDKDRDQLAYLLAMTQLQVANHDWAGTDRLLQLHQEPTSSSWQLLRTHVTALRRLGQPDAALDRLDRGTAGSPAQRSSLRIECLVDARRYREADRALQDVWEHGAIDELGGTLLAPMVTAAQEIGGLPLARSVLSSVERNAPADRLGEVLRLSQIFLNLRLDSLEALAEARLAPPSAPSEQLVLRQLEEAGEGLPGIDDLRALCLKLADRRGTAPASLLLDTSFVLSDALEVAVRIIDAVDSRTPLSLLRLGDGEGALLPYRAELAPFRATDISENSTTWWGAGSADASTVAAELEAAITTADIVGMPELDRATRVFLQTERTAQLANGRNMRGLLAATDFVIDRCWAALWTSCHIHQSLSFWGLWDLLLPRLGVVDLITCHGQLGQTLAAAYGVTVGRTHLIPPEHKYAAAFSGTSAESHFPTVYERLRVTLAQPQQGRTYLVSAGLLGKIYCDWIKQRGGVAIDIGSAADHWCGYGTRSISDVATYRSPTGTAELVRALVAAHPRYSALVRPLAVRPTEGIAL